MKNPHFVYVNSRDRDSGTDEDFSYNVKIPSGIKFTHVVCLNVLIPKSYYLIQEGPLENIFQLQEDDIILTLQVPFGSYLLTAFQKQIETLLTTIRHMV